MALNQLRAKSWGQRSCEYDWVACQIDHGRMALSTSRNRVTEECACGEGPVAKGTDAARWSEVISYAPSGLMLGERTRNPRLAPWAGFLRRYAASQPCTG